MKHKARPRARIGTAKTPIRLTQTHERGHEQQQQQKPLHNTDTQLLIILILISLKHAANTASVYGSGPVWTQPVYVSLLKTLSSALLFIFFKGIQELFCFVSRAAMKPSRQQKASY